MTGTAETEQLLAAVRAGDTAGARKALTAGADPNGADGDSTALCHAVFDGHRSILKRLLDTGADPNKADARGFTPLSLAASKDQSSFIKLLAAAGADVNLTSGQAEGTALHVATAEGSTKAAKALITAGADVDALDCFRATPLHYAAMHGRDKIAAQLLKAEASPDLVDDGGMTPLLHALVKMGQPRVMDWSYPGLHNDTPVTFRIVYGEFFADENGEKRWMPAKAIRELAEQAMPEYATYLGCRAVAQKLLKAGADATRVVSGGRTPLHLAASLGEKALVDALCRAAGKGCLEVRDERGRTVAHHAAGSHRADLLKLSKRLAKADFEAVDGDGWRPLHHAAASGDVDVIRHLRWQCHVSPFVSPRPVDVAVEAGHEEAAAALRDFERGQSPKDGEPLPDWWFGIALERPEQSYDVEWLIECLDAGTHYYGGALQINVRRDGLTRVHAIVGDTWIEARCHDDGSLSQEWTRLRPADELRQELRGRATDGRVTGVLATPAAYPDALASHLADTLVGATTVMAALDGGAEWLRIGATYAILHHERLGPLSIGLKEGAVESVSSTTEERAAESANAPAATFETIPPPALARVEEVGEKHLALVAAIEGGAFCVINSEFDSEVRLSARVSGEAAALELRDGRVHDARFNNAADRLDDSLWFIANRDLSLSPMPDVHPDDIALLRAVIERDVPEVREGLLASRLAITVQFNGALGELVCVDGDIHHRSTSTYPFRDKRLDAKQLEDTLTNGDIWSLTMHPAPRRAPHGSDDELAIIARRLHPNRLKHARHHSGVETYFPYGDRASVSVLGARLFFQNVPGSSDTRQDMHELLNKGPVHPLPEEVLSSLRESVRTIIATASAG